MSVDEVIKVLKRVLGAYEDVLMAYLFGSYARGFQKPLSDLDLAVLVTDRAIIPDITAEISKHLGIAEDNISVVDLKLVDPSLILKILNEGVEIINRNVNPYDVLPLTSEVTEVYELENRISLKRWLRSNSLDVGIIREIITRIVEDHQDLRELLVMDYERVMNDKHLRKSFERTLHTLIEGMMDILRHIIAGFNLGIATYYRDYAIIAENRGVISRRVEEGLERLIAIRHVLVHRYRRLRYEELWKEAKESVEMINDFLNEVREYLRIRLGAL